MVLLRAVVFIFDSFVVHGNSFQREAVAAPTPTDDDRVELDTTKGQPAEETGRNDHKPLFLRVVRVHTCCTFPFSHHKTLSTCDAQL